MARELSLPPIEPSITPEAEPQPRFDTIMVFGQGPVKEIKLLGKLSPQEREQWDKFVQDIRDKKYTEEDLNFYAIDGEDLSPEELQEFQHMGRFALKRLGRLNALAAGYALVTGQTRELILSGGHTQSDAVRSIMEEKYIRSLKEKGEEEEIEKYSNSSDTQKKRVLDDYAAKDGNWPSEAELMKDVIWRRFSPEFRVKYLREHPEVKKDDPDLDTKVKQEFDRVVKTEDEATNTLENFALTIDKNPDVFSKKVGLLSVNHHLRRILLLANRFTIDAAEADEVSSQIQLEKRANQRTKKAYEKLLRTELPETVKFGKDEKKWIAGLEDPQYVLYWLPYIAEIKDPGIVQRIIKRLNNSSWVSAIRDAFAKVNLDFQDLENEDLVELSKRDPKKYEEFRTKLAGLLQYRTLPPESLAA